jgi:RNA polymerase sigma-70 factor, ECF subfamily
MLKRQDDAEDVVQEAFARLAAASLDAIEDVRGWLVVVTRRLCLDRLDLAESRRTTATAEPPEAAGAPGVPAAPAGIQDPADRMVLRDELRQALSVVIDRLSPAERTSFILHDIFGFPFDAVAGLVGRNPAACRQLARRARLSVGTGSSHAELAAAWPGSTKAAGLAERFIAVCEGGDVDGLIGLLDPEAASFPVVIGMPPLPAVRGAGAVAGRAMHFFGPSAGVSLYPFDLEGRAAVVVRRGEEVVAVVRLDDREGGIFHLHTVAYPSLAHLWGNVLPRIGVSGRLLAPDLIGMGSSGKPDIPYHFDDHARYLDAWFEALELDSVVLVGHDWGGALAFDWAARHPGRTRGVVFMEAIIRPQSWDEFPAHRQPRDRELRAGGPSGSPRSARSDRRGDHSLGAPALPALGLSGRAQSDRTASYLAAVALPDSGANSGTPRGADPHSPDGRRRGPLTVNAARPAAKTTMAAIQPPRSVAGRAAQVSGSE